MKRLVVLSIALYLTSAVCAQTYLIGESPGITTCSGFFYDHGGPSGFAGDQAYQISFESATGECLAFDFQEFDLGLGAVLEVYEGIPGQGGLRKGSYSGTNSPGIVTGNVLSFRYIPSIFPFGNAHGWKAKITCGACLNLPDKTDPASDCDGAIPLCNNNTVIVSTNQYTDTGNDDDEDGSCMSGTGSGGSVWYTFSPQTAGPLGFAINPAGGTDYDFVLYDATNGCADLDELNCNYSADYGSTGMSTNSSNYNDMNCSGCVSRAASCVRWNCTSNVDPTHTYMLFVNFYSGSNDGFVLDFQHESGIVSIADLTPPTIENVTSTSCNGNTLYLDFSENCNCATIQNGDITIPGYTITVTSTGACNNNMTQGVEVSVSPPLPAGSYTLHGQNIEDMCGNNMNDDFTFSVAPSSVDVSASGSDFCEGTTATLTATANSTYPVTYQWSTGSTASSIVVSTSGTYTVTGTDNCGVSDFATVTVNEIPAPAPIVGVTCNGSGATVNGSGCSGTLHWYKWDEVCEQVCTGVVIFGNCIGGSWITVCDSDWVDLGTTGPVLNLTAPYASQYRAVCDNACDPETVFQITCNNPVSVSLSGSTICTGDCADLTAVVSGGTAPFNFAWSSGGFTGAGPNSVCPTTTTSYSVTVTDGIGATATASASVGVVTVDVQTVSSQSPTCGNTNGSITVSASGGTASYSYAWAPGGYTGASISNVGAGSYTVTATDQNGCTATEIIQLSSSSSVTVSVTATDVICPGGSDGTATATPGGGVTPYTYLWSNAQTGQTATGLPEGIAYVTVTDGASCETIGSVVVGLSGASISASVVSQDVSCNGLYDGTADVSVTGGSSPYSYTWSSGQTNASVTGLESGFYSVTVEDIYGCVDTASVMITEPDAIVFGSITLTWPLCAGNANGSLSVSAS
ncbi:MAG: SprB repeat-containing protein [Bacteroidetes bacterium]|nr:SprB repeat-containing protein [Bacteroidota bacterium]